MMVAELKPCPFCATGLPPKVERRPRIGTYVVCVACCCQGPTHGTAAEAIAAWNTRHTPIDRDFPRERFDAPFTHPSTPPAVSDDLVEEMYQAFGGDIARVNFAVLLPIIQRREQMAAEAMRERCAAEADANRHEEREVAEAIADAIRSLTTEGPQ